MKKEILTLRDGILPCYDNGYNSANGVGDPNKKGMVTLSLNLNPNATTGQDPWQMDKEHFSSIQPTYKGVARWSQDGPVKVDPGTDENPVETNGDWLLQQMENNPNTVQVQEIQISTEEADLGGD